MLVLGTALLVTGCKSTSISVPIVERSKPRKVKQAAPVADRYIVQAGDTLYKIAFDHGLDYRELARWNDLRNPDLIHAGTTLRLKPPVESTASRAGAEPRAANTVPESEVPETDPDSWIWPVRGKVLATFNETEGRKGIDIGVPLGTSIQAAAPGRVVYAGQGLRGYGKLTIIRHSKSLLSAYAHQSRMLIKEGDQVIQGQKIGEVGDTDAERAKLHFEIREYGRPVNPSDFLPS